MILFLVLILLIVITTFVENFAGYELNLCPLQILKRKGKYTIINNRDKFYIPNKNPRVLNNVELLDIIKKTENCNSIQDLEDVSRKYVVKTDELPNHDRICNHKIAYLKDKLMRCYNKLGERCDIIEEEIPSMNTCYINQFVKEFPQYKDNLDSGELNKLFK